MIEALKNFTTKVSKSLNLITQAQKIECSLYEQDDKDKQQTVLYGINEEMGAKEVKAQTPIQVNNNCLQCSGNASFIKKAFKLACLTYASSRVKHDEVFYSREDLMEKRQSLIDKIECLDVREIRNVSYQHLNGRHLVRVRASATTLEGAETPNLGDLQDDFDPKSAASDNSNPMEAKERGRT